MIAAAAGDNVRILAVDTSEEACKKVRTQWQCMGTPMFSAKRSIYNSLCCFGSILLLFLACLQCADTQYDMCSVQVTNLTSRALRTLLSWPGNWIRSLACPLVDGKPEPGKCDFVDAMFGSFPQLHGDITTWCCMTGLLLLTPTGRWISKRL